MTFRQVVAPGRRRGRLRIRIKLGSRPSPGWRGCLRSLRRFAS